MMASSERGMKLLGSGELRLKISDLLKLNSKLVIC